MAQDPEPVASGLCAMSSVVPGSTSVHEFEETVAELVPYPLGTLGRRAHAPLRRSYEGAIRA